MLVQKFGRIPQDPPTALYKALKAQFSSQIVALPLPFTALGSTRAPERGQRPYNLGNDHPTASCVF